MLKLPLDNKLVVVYKKDMEKITIKKFLKELERLEPKNIVDYIFKGSALTQWIKKYKIK